VSAERKFSFGARIRSFRHAFAGLRTMLSTQHNAWIHAGMTLVALGLGVALSLTRSEWCWIVIAIVSVWTAEALNTAFELLCDVAAPEFHPRVKQAKDVAAGAVLLCALGSLVIGLLIFVPRLLALV
jgi:diacylglycerol kinase (ATP)